MKITIGSTNPRKITAVRIACGRLNINAVVSGAHTSSGQNEQPVGFDETFAGALARAEAVHEKKLGDIAIGIESGIFRFGKDSPVTLDMAVVVVITENGRHIIATSSGIQFPEECVKAAEIRGFKTNTAGAAIAEKFGGDAADPHSTLTAKKISRTMTLADAITTALRQI